MKRILLAGAATAVLLASSPAQAGDERLVNRAYKADEVVRVDGRLGVQATIAFAEDEHIENVAVGDSASWQITPNKRANLLFVKPLSARARTNMTVITDRHRYYFDLVAPSGEKPVYVLNFTYPDDPKRDAAGQAAAAPLTDAEELAIGGEPNEQPVDPAALNFKWARKGSTKLMPSRIYDDGMATYISWAAGNPVPAILVRNEKGEEGPVNFAVRSDVIVIDDVPGLIVLRSGKASAELENRGEPRKPAGQATSPATALAKADASREK